MNATSQPDEPNGTRSRDAVEAAGAAVTASIAVDLVHNSGTLVVGTHNVVHVSGVSAPVVVARPPADVHRPQRISGFLDRRQDSVRLAAALGAGRAVQVSGEAGIGKTWFLRHAAAGAAGAFEHGALRLSPSLRGADELLQNVFELYFDSTPPQRPSHLRLREWLAPCRALLLADDARLDAAALSAAFDVLPQCALLLADSAAPEHTGATTLPLAGLPTEDALTLLERLRGEPLEGPQAAQALALVARVQGHPRRLADLAGTLDSPAAPPAPAADAAALTAFNTGGAAQRALVALPPPARDALAALLAFAPQPLARSALAPDAATAEAAAQALLAAGLALGEQVTAPAPAQAAASSNGDDDDTTLRLAPAAAALLAGTDPAEAARQRVQRLAEAGAALPSAAPATRRRRLAAWLPALWTALAQATNQGDAQTVRRLAHAWHAPLALCGRWDALRALLQTHLQLAQLAGDAAGAAWALHQLGTEALSAARFDLARSLLQRSLEVGAGSAEPALVAATKQQLHTLDAWLQGLGGQAQTPSPSTPPPAASPAPPPPPPPPPPVPVSWIVGGLLALGAAGGGAWWFSAPELSADAQQLAFADQDLRALASAPAQALSVTLHNDGWRAARPGPARIEGGDGAYTLTDAQACATALGSEARCTLQVTFRPSRPGPHPAVLRLDGLALAVPLTGTARAGRLQAEPDQGLDFGSTAIGSSGAVQALRLRNAGDAALVVRRPDALAAPFELRSDGCGGRELAPGAACSLGLAFRPRQGGPAAAVLRLASDVPGAALLEVPLRGTALAPDWTLEPAALAFGDVMPGAAADAATRSLRLRSTGTGALRLGNARLDGTAGSFALSGDGCSGRVLAAGASCEIGVRALPGGARGLRSARLLLDADRAGRVAVPLSGRWRAGELSAQPAALDFGSVALSLFSRLRERGPEQDLRVINSGDAPLRPGPVRLGGAQAAAFSVTGGTCDAELAPDAACTLRLRFVPRDSRRAEALLTFAGPAADGRPLVVRLAGLGATPAPAPAPAPSPAPAPAPAPAPPAPVRLEARLPPDGTRIECQRGSNVRVPFAWRGPADQRLRVVLTPLGTVWEGTGPGALVTLPCRPQAYSWQVETVGTRPAQQSAARSLTLNFAVPAQDPPSPPPTGSTAPAAGSALGRSGSAVLQRTPTLGNLGACCLEHGKPPAAISSERCRAANGRWHAAGAVPATCDLHNLR